MPSDEPTGGWSRDDVSCYWRLVNGLHIMGYDIELGGVDVLSGLWSCVVSRSNTRWPYWQLRRPNSVFRDWAEMDPEALARNFLIYFHDMSK